MNFDKFKSIQPKPADIKEDAQYTESLLALKPRKKSSILPIVGTVAASFIIIIAVTAWALIGRGVRNGVTDDPIVPPADNGESIEITDDVRTKLERMYNDHYMFLLENFDESHPLSVEQILKYCKDTNWEKYDYDLTRDEFAQFAKERFGYDVEIPQDLVFDVISNTIWDTWTPDVVSMTVNDGIATVKYRFSDQLDTVQYTYDDDEFTPLTFISFKNETVPQNNSGAYPGGIKTTILDIARQYHFDRIHPFEEGELPYYVRYHVAAFIKGGKIKQFWNKNGGLFLGIPYDDYKETILRLYGKDDMEGKNIRKFSEMETYEKYGDLIEKDGELYVNLEIGGGLEPDFKILDHKVDGDRVIVKYQVYSVGTDYDSYTPDTNILTYTSDDGLTPKQFISCLVATSEPLAPNDDIEYMSEPEFLAYIPHYAFDVEFDQDDYAWAEDGLLSTDMTYGDLYADLWTFIKKYHFYGVNVGDFVTLTEQNKNTPIPRAEINDILKRLEKVLVVDNISLRFQSGNRCTIDGKSVDFFEATAFFEIAKVIKVEYKAERPKNCHVLNITRVYGPTETGAYVNDNVYFTENQVYWNKCLYTVTDDYFTGLLNTLK